MTTETLRRALQRDADARRAEREAERKAEEDSALWERLTLAKLASVVGRLTERSGVGVARRALSVVLSALNDEGDQ